MADHRRLIFAALALLLLMAAIWVAIISATNW